MSKTYKCNKCITRPVLRESGYDSTGTSALVCPVCDTFYTINGEEKTEAENRIAEEEEKERKAKEKVKKEAQEAMEEDYAYYGFII